MERNVEEVYSEEPATTNLNKFFAQLDSARAPIVGKKRAAPEPITTVAQEEFSQAAQKYAQKEERKEEDVSSVIKFGAKSMIRGIDIALGYDGSAVKILDDPETAEALNMMLVQDSNTRELIRSYKQFMPLVALAGILLSYHSYRTGWVESMERAIETNPATLKKQIEAPNAIDPEGEEKKYMREMLEKK